MSTRQIIRWRPACRPHRDWIRGSSFSRLDENLLDDHWIFNAGNHLPEPPHSRLVSMSILNTRLRRYAQFIDGRGSAAVCSWPSSLDLGLLPLPIFLPKTRITQCSATTDRHLNLLHPSDITHHTINSSSFLTDANIDATYNRTPLEPNRWFPMDKPNPTLYN